jgi:hypothetical protein
MIDQNKVLRQWLISDSDVIAQAPANHICFPDLADAAAPNKGEKWISLQRAPGGTSHPEAPIFRVVFRVACWGKNGLEAQSIYSAVHDRLHASWQSGGANYQSGGIRLDEGTIIHSVEQEGGGPEDFTDPDTGWKAVVGFFVVTMRATA